MKGHDWEGRFDTSVKKALHRLLFVRYTRLQQEEMIMKIDRIHHVAYRCKDAKETVNWYVDNLNMDFILAIAEDHVPSTHEPDPYMHVFLDAGNDNVLAFFELPTKPEMGRDPNTPEWVQHIAFKVKDRETLIAFKEKLEKNGVEVLGITDHSIFHSIYFFDPNGHRVELATPEPNGEEMLSKLDAVKWDMLEEWSKTKRAPKHAAWLHEKELDDA
jgi:catechol 2,3-dioxygenase-like lactoylglutathione lyase family enzyme